MRTPLTEFIKGHYNEACSRCEKHILAFLKAKEELDKPATNEEFLDQYARYENSMGAYRSYWDIRESFDHNLINKRKFKYFLESFGLMANSDTPSHRQKFRLVIRALKKDLKEMNAKKPKTKVIK